MQEDLADLVRIYKWLMSIYHEHEKAKRREKKDLLSRRHVSKHE